jgi:hypothetical protein
MTRRNPILADATLKRCLTVAESDDGMARMLRMLIDQGGRVALTDDDGSVECIELSAECKALLAQGRPAPLLQLARPFCRPRRGTRHVQVQGHPRPL